jgi:hypothetical protein
MPITCYTSIVESQTHDMSGQNTTLLGTDPFTAYNAYNYMKDIEKVQVLLPKATKLILLDQQQSNLVNAGAKIAAAGGFSLAKKAVDSSSCN